MAKLNKQEVNAVASKLYRELSKVAEEMRRQAMEHYTPSEVYSKVQALIEKRDAIENELCRLSSDLKQVRKELIEVCPFFVYDSDSKDTVLDRIIRSECQLPEVPSVEELKDEVTIAAIDDSFNTLSFIENQIAKFK